MKKMQTKVGKLKVGYWTLVSAVSALMFSVMPVLAADKNPNIWDRFSAIMRDFYGQILAISTIVAVTSPSTSGKFYHTGELQHHSGWLFRARCH